MKHFIQFATLLLLGTAVHAQSATGALAASRPTQYTNGQTMPATDIAGYDWSCSFTPTGGSAAACTGFTGGSVTGSNPNTSVTFTAPAVGGKACFQAVTRSIGGTSSVPSAAACKDIAAAVPNPPNNVTVTVTLTLNLSSATPITVAMSQPVVTTKP